jgi:5-methylcytosine-specific restriction endonuclease McrA
MEENLLTTRQVCELLKCSDQTVRKYELQGRLHPVKNFSTISKLYSPEEVQQLGADLTNLISLGNRAKGYTPQKERDAKPVPQRVRFFILQRDNFRCCACGRNPEEDGVKLEIDHKVSRSRGGTNSPDNLWTLCQDCNRGKSHFNADAS